MIETVKQRIRDGWENIITGLGTTRDKRLGARVTAVPPVADYSRLEDLYHGDDMARKIAGKAPADMVRKWISLAIELGDPGVSGKEAELADDTLQALNDLDAKGKFREALTWAQVYGGAVIVIGADDGGGDMASLAEPLNEDRIRSIKFLEVFDRFDLQIESEYDDPKDGLEKFTRPKTYRIVNYSGTRGANLSSQIVHESRCLRFDGPLTSRRRRIQNDGWSDSVYTKIDALLADFGLSWAGAAHLLSDFASAVFKMAGLADAVAGGEDNLVIERMILMDKCRSMVRATPIDKDDEEYTRQPTPVSGLPELLDRFMLRLAAAADMPVTVLFGVSPAGLNSSAEGDLTIWYDSVESRQETDLRPPLTRLIDLLFASKDGPTKGAAPEGWELNFNPLWQESAKEKAETRKIIAETDAIYIDTGVVEPEEITMSRFGGESYSSETKIDKERREAEAEETPAAPQPAPEPTSPAVPPLV
jgi:phage-related protein (TIGR01555 family)